MIEIDWLFGTAVGLDGSITHYTKGPSGKLEPIIIQEKTMDVKELFAFQPHFEDIETAEPSLEDIIFRYYQPHLGTIDAGRLTNAYIAAITDIMA